MNSWFLTSNLGNFQPNPFGSEYSLLILTINYKSIFRSLVKSELSILKQYEMYDIQLNYLSTEVFSLPCYSYQDPVAGSCIFFGCIKLFRHLFPNKILQARKVSLLVVPILH